MPDALAPLDEELSVLIESVVAGEAHGWRRQQHHEQRRQQGDEQQQAGALAGTAPLRRMPPLQRPAFLQPPECAFLRPGQHFEGQQRVSACHGPGFPKQEHWEVAVTVQVGRSSSAEQRAVGSSS